VKVLRQTANFEHSLISYKTIHKLLGLKEKIDEISGKISFEREFGTESDIDKQDALAIDETSMLNDEIFALVNEQNQRGGRDSQAMHEGDYFKVSGPADLKIIFLGDPVQIPPVGKDDCIPFNENNAASYGIKTLHLTTIIRQKEGNPILELATTIREHYKSARIPYLRETVSNSVGTVAFINSADKDVLYRICETYFASDQFAHDSDFMKVIAWTNKTVDFMNDKIRGYIYKDKLAEIIAEDPGGRLPRILVGEKLIANTPIVSDIGYKVVIEFQTNDEFEVVSYNIKERKVFENYTVTVYETKVTYRNYSTDKMENKTIDILHEKSLHTYQEILKTLMDRAKKAQPALRGQSWKLYYSMRNKFADIKYNYAITAHKSQGSTYDNAIVIAVDINKNSKIEERNRILYVATTRAKHNLFMVE
jgi:exodeoxyribonuclease-5